MNPDSSQIRSLIQNGRDALRRGNMAEARGWAEQVTRLAPELEDGWLLLAAVSTPNESLRYAQRALKINPRSTRAAKAMDWARRRAGMDEAPAPAEERPAPRNAYNPNDEEAEPAPRRRWLVPTLVGALVCVVLAFAAWSARNSSVLASVIKSANEAPASPTAKSEEPISVPIELDKPTYTPEWTFTPSVEPTFTFTSTPTLTFTPESTNTPLPTETPLPTDTPGVMEVSILVDTPTSIPPTAAPYVAPTQQVNNPPVSGGARWIDINLSTQRLFAYEGDTVVNSFIVSTGVAATPTVTGTYKIYARYVYADMRGPGYYLPDVPYTQYFYKSYGIHGTYWHNNFGTPMSHGCVNLSIPDAGWLYDWATFGTVVKVHY